MDKTCEHILQEIARCRKEEDRAIQNADLMAIQNAHIKIRELESEYKHLRAQEEGRC